MARDFRYIDRRYPIEGRGVDHKTAEINRSIRRMLKDFLHCESTMTTVDGFDRINHNERIKFVRYIHSKRNARFGKQVSKKRFKDKDIRFRYLSKQYLVEKFTKNGQGIEVVKKAKARYFSNIRGHKNTHAQVVLKPLKHFTVVMRTIPHKPENITNPYAYISWQVKWKGLILEKHGIEP